VFKEYGITDENNLQVAKDKIIISFKKWLLGYLKSSFK
jgi:hypothetical protein